MKFDHNIVAALVRRLGGSVQITLVEIADLRAGHLEFVQEARTQAWRFTYREESAAPLKVEVRDASGRRLNAVLLEAPD